MIKFLFKGLLRDRSRSLFPVLIVLIGVALTVFLFSYLNGVVSDMIKSSAHFGTGHLRIMTKAYAKESDQSPNDLAFLGLDTLSAFLKKNHPDIIWTPRIRFGGLLDVPDKNGDTRAQGPVMGLALDLFSKSSPERKIMNIDKSLAEGKIPSEPGEILISGEFAQKLGIKPGDLVTLISSTMYGSMAVVNFTVSGTIQFGVAAMDRGAIIADISDIQSAFDMQNAAGEILGFFPDDNFHEEKADQIAATFNDRFVNSKDQFSPVMGTLPNESGLGDYMKVIGSASIFIIGIFITAMSIVLWNAGLMGSLRRYGEIGVRLAMGENKKHIYNTLIVESIMIGLVGSLLGTMIGLIPAYLMEIYGLDISFLFQNSSMLMSGVIHAQVSFGSYLIGFIPGLTATILGSSIAGIGIFRRETAQLFKELEV